jgi:hypothetical protein
MGQGSTRGQSKTPHLRQTAMMAAKRIVVPDLVAIAIVRAAARSPVRRRLPAAGSLRLRPTLRWYGGFLTTT